MTRAIRIISFQAAALVTGALLLSVIAGMAQAVPAPAAAAVQIGNFTFKNPVVTVKVGTTVTWTNGDDIPHTVVSKDGVFKSKVLDTGDRFTFTFAKPGQFGYFCSLHPHMTGQVIVKA
ncbi:MAG: plastocyanin/azurin family copper-binding protein [Sphingomonas sp.]